VEDDYRRISTKTSMRVTGLVTCGDKSRIPVLDAAALYAGFCIASIWTPS